MVPAPGLPHYAAAKHGVIGLTRNAAAEYANEGIRVNAVLPGITRSAMTTHWFEGQDLTAQADRLFPRGRAGEPEDIAEAIVWLASARGGWVSGQSLVVDGGGVFH
ncbi:MAG: SDR family oxidoreductase [Actinomycetota bacterium]